MLWHNRTHSAASAIVLCALSRLFYNLRMGNRLNERVRRTDQPYPQPGHPGDFSQQDRNRNSRPGHPGDFSHVSHQDGDRNSRPEHPGASLKQDGDRNPQPGHPGDFSHQDGDRNSRPEHSVASLHRNEGTCFLSRVAWMTYPSGEGMLPIIVVDEILIGQFKVS